MNKRIQQLAEQAGFVFWQNESWGPGPGNIDWGGDYKDEFAEFVRLLVNESAYVAAVHSGAAAEVGNIIKQHFGVEQ